MTEKWQEALLSCAEISYVVDDETKALLWLNGSSCDGKEPCWEKLMCRDTPCPFCAPLQPDSFYVCDGYDQQAKRWLKVKHKSFFDGERWLRAGNMNVFDDTMFLVRESVHEISHLNTQLGASRRIKAVLEREANHDRMTGLFNRNRFNLDISSGKYDCAGVGVLYFDMNNLKKINDRYGHTTGDKLICQLAMAILDTAQNLANATCYRIGGDEFVILLLDCSEETLRDARAYFDQKLNGTADQPPCIVAVGSAFAKTKCDVKTLVSQADRAMYEDKVRLKRGDSATTAEKIYI